jgi:hypothetical protein
MVPCQRGKLLSSGTAEQRHDHIGAHHSFIGESRCDEPSGLIDVKRLGWSPVSPL